jgi:hypothetical protein
MTTAIYDNPATMAREAWQDGKLIGHTTACLLLSRDFRGHRNWPFYFSVGPWSPGQLIGDRAAVTVTE